jgi:hypothetical protein
MGANATKPTSGLEIVEQMLVELETTVRDLFAERRRQGLDLPDEEIEMFVRFARRRLQKAIAQAVMSAYSLDRYHTSPSDTDVMTKTPEGMAAIKGMEDQEITRKLKPVKS